MTKDQKERLQELEVKYHVNYPKREKLTEEEWEELQELRDLRETEITEAVVRPICCEAARRYPAITFCVDYGDEDSNTTNGKWSITTNEYLTRYESSKGNQVVKYYENKPEPKFCPYCATPLPKMVRKNPMPEGICRVTDGGYYCDTCEERLMGCKCLPLSAAFEPE